MSKAVAFFVGASMVASIVPAGVGEPHVETIRGELDAAMLEDAAIVSTHTGAPPAIGKWPGTKMQKPRPCARSNGATWIGESAGN